MGNGVAHDGVNARSGIYLFNAVNIAQLLRRYLSGGGFLAASCRGEGKGAASPQAQNSADEALLAHAHADQGGPVAFAAEEFDHLDVVGESGCGADELVIVGRVRPHFFQRLVELLCGAEVVEGEDQAGASPEL